MRWLLLVAALYGTAFWLVQGCAEPHDRAHGYVTACFLCDGNGECTEAPCDENGEAIRPEALAPEHEL